MPRYVSSFLSFFVIVYLIRIVIAAEFRPESREFYKAGLHWIPPGFDWNPVYSRVTFNRGDVPVCSKKAEMVVKGAFSGACFHRVYAVRRLTFDKILYYSITVYKRASRITPEACSNRRCIPQIISYTRRRRCPIKS